MKPEQIASCPVTCAPYHGEVYDVRGFSLPAEYFHAVAVSNGFATTNGIFRFLGVNSDLGFGDLASKNNPALSKAYLGDLDKLVFFAEDIFGDRYAFMFRHRGDTDPSLIKFICEGGDIEVLPFLTLTDLLEVGVFPVPSVLDTKLADSAFAMGLRPALDQHLAFRLPLILGGEYALENLGVESAALHLDILAQASNQIAKERSGTQIMRFDQIE